MNRLANQVKKKGIWSTVNLPCKYDDLNLAGYTMVEWSEDPSSCNQSEEKSQGVGTVAASYALDRKHGL